MDYHINKIIEKSILFIESNNFESYDISDALTSNWLNKFTYKSNLLRRIVIQINARSPISLHGLGMKKMVHTKLISDLLWAHSINQTLNKTFLLYRKLINLRCEGSEYVWGLNFPYTSRFINANINTPNLYNTSTTGLALCEFLNINHIDGDDKIVEDLKVIIANIIDSIYRVFTFTDEKSKGWFAYYPGQKEPTYNVNALSAYFLCKANNAGVTTDKSKEVILKLINLLITEQNSEGSWYYSRSEKGKWIDGFHTGFIIESLAYLYSHGYESKELRLTLLKAWKYYTQNLFTLEGFPKLFNNSNKFPVEAQNCAQAIQTLSLVGLWLNWHHKDLLKLVIANSLNNLYNSKGYFYYKKNKYYTLKQSYLRWSTSPMLVALSYANKYLNQSHKIQYK